MKFLPCRTKLPAELAGSKALLSVEHLLKVKWRLYLCDFSNSLFSVHQSPDTKRRWATSHSADENFSHCVQVSLVLFNFPYYPRSPLPSLKSMVQLLLLNLNSVELPSAED